jgi:type VI secretion system protein VasJ
MGIEEYGITPIDISSPTGENVRCSQEMDLLSAELEKLNNPSSTKATDWGRVEEIAGQILSKQSKDLLVASYLGFALSWRQGITGLDQALSLLRSLSENFWESMYPEITRLRGRKQALQWWADKTLVWLRNNPVPAQAAELMGLIRENLDALDRFLAGVMEDPPSFGELRNAIREIPLLSGCDEPPVPEQTTGATEEVAAKKHLEEPQPQAKRAVNKPAPSPPAESGATLANTEVTGADSARWAINSAIDSIRRVAGFYRSADLFDPEAFRLVRIAVSLAIAFIPADTEGITSIPEPSSNLQESLWQLRHHEKWRELLDTTEYYIPIHPHWLDLCFHSTLALDRLEQGDLARLTERLIATCMQRLSGMELLSFSEGTPFASEETCDWLSTISAPAESRRTERSQGMEHDAEPAGTSLRQSIEADLQQALEIKKKASLHEALLFLEKGLDKSSSACETVLRRTALVSFLAGAKKAKAAIPHADRLISDIDNFHIEAWEPETALDILTEAYLAYSSSTKSSSKEKAETVLARIAGISPSRALGLEQ